MKYLFRVFFYVMFLVMIAALVGIFTPAPVARAFSSDNLLAPLADPDGDGLDDSVEIMIGTDPNNVDSDCDFIDDGTEAGNPESPTNTDGDGVIDALENNLANSDYPADTVKDHQDASTSVQATCGRFRPFAIANNGSDTSTLEVRVTGSGITAVSVQAPATISFPGLIKLDGVDITGNQNIALYDDGSHGDRRSGDGIWTRNGFTSNYGISVSYWALEFGLYKIDVTTGAITTRINWFDPSVGPFNNLNHQIKIGVVKSSEVQTPISMGAGHQAVSHLLNILNPKGSLDPKDAWNSEARKQAAAKSVYALLGDDYDFMFFFSDAFLPVSYTAFYWGVQNDVQNIGRSIYNDSTEYGSSGKLQGLMFMNFASNGPTLHELMHRWAAPNLTSLGFHQCTDTGHWGVSGVGKGQLGGFAPPLTDLGGGLYRAASFGVNANGGDSTVYVPIELYLAGFLDAASVPNITIPNGVNCSTLVTSGGYTTFQATGGTTTVTMAQVQAALGGSRIPDVSASQKNFKAAMVIISQETLTAAEIAFYNAWSKNLGAEIGTDRLKSFKEATGGVANLDTTIIKPGGPEINVRWANGGSSIVNGDSTPSANDGTDFGVIKVIGLTSDRTFRIENLGDASLTLSGSPLVSISGAHASDFTVIAGPDTPVVPGGYTTFTIRFDPSAEGLRTATISISNSDVDENPYTFSVQGTGGDPVYCASTHSASSGPYVSRTQLNTGDQTSSRSANGYADYTGFNFTNLQFGSNYPLQVTAYSPWVPEYQQFVKVWVDFNQDGDFIDDGEEFDLGSYTFTGSHVFSGVVSVPSGIFTGTTRMRVLVTNLSTQTGPCSASYYGETEDYTVNLVVPTPLPGAFNKSAPTNGATGVSTSPTLLWGASSGATSYEYCYDTTNNSACDGSWTSAGTNTSVGLSGLSSNTTYYWQVRAVNAGGTTYADSGAWWSFTTQVSAPGAFNKSAPTNGATGVSTSPTLSWGASSGATSYEYCYDTTNNSACDGTWTLAGTNTSVGLSGLSNNTTYYWQVRAVNAGGTTYANSDAWWSFTTQVSAPGAFSKSAPANGATGVSTSPTLSWGASSGATSYEYCYDTTNNSACDGSWTLAGTNTSVGLSGLSNNTIYYWQVRAVNAGGTTYADSSAWWSFTTEAGVPSNNDDFDAPIDINGLPYNNTQSVAGYTTAVDDPSLCVGGYGYQTAWYRFSPSQDGTFAFDTIGSEYDTILAVWYGTRGSLTMVACDDDSGGGATSLVSASLTGGEVYFIEIAAWDNGVTNLTLNARAVSPPAAFSKSAPANDATGISLSPMLSWNVSSGATSYSYCYDTTNNDVCDTDWNDAGTSTSAAISGLLPNTTYYWQVEAYNNDGSTEANAGAWWSFTTQNYLGQVRYAAPSAAGAGNCSSWANACTLQTALTQAIYGDEIWVKAGLYKPGAAQSATFPLKSGVAVYGGYAGTETNRSQRNWQANLTVLSGDVDNNDLANSQGVVTETIKIQGNNAYNVVSGDHVIDATLDGFVITAGWANDSEWPHYTGGGLFCSESTLVLANLTFSGNFAETAGGVFATQSSLSLTNVAFSRNQATYGGGMGNISSEVTLTNVSFNNNTAQLGGGLYNSSSTLTMLNTVFYRNAAQSHGGGLVNDYFSGATLINTTFASNSAEYGGGIHNVWYSDLSLANSILWGNTASEQGAQIYSEDSTSNVTYSDVQGCGSSGTGWNATCGADGGGNIDANPMFMNMADSNLRLLLNSPAIDAGNNAAVPTGVTTDLDNNPRFVNVPTVPDTGSGAPPIVDMGAYEAQAQDTTAPTVISILRTDPNPTSAASVRYTVTFSEGVAGVDAADFVLTKTGSIAGASIVSVTGSGTTYTVTVNTGSGDGSLRLDVPNTATINDLAGNPLAGLPYTSGQVYDVMSGYMVFLPWVKR
jgi:hypothetical protein